MNKLMEVKKNKKTEPTERLCPECLSKIPFKAKKCKFCGSKVD